MWRLILKNLIRNKRRTLLTAASVAVSLFLLSALAIVYTALGKPFEGLDTVPIMMVRRAAGIDRKSTRLNSSHSLPSRMPSSA